MSGEIGLNIAWELTEAVDKLCRRQVDSGIWEKHPVPGTATTVYYLSSDVLTYDVMNRRVCTASPDGFSLRRPLLTTENEAELSVRDRRLVHITKSHVYDADGHRIDISRLYNEEAVASVRRLISDLGNDTQRVPSIEETS